MTGPLPFPAGLVTSSVPPMEQHSQQQLSAQQIQQLLQGLGAGHGPNLTAPMIGTGAPLPGACPPHGAANLAVETLLAQLSNSQGGPAVSTGPVADGDGRPPARGGGGRHSRASGEARPASSYNARHQQAEARRRSRINERLEALRQLVPHTERANTANFLEEVVQYVQRLQNRVVELERQLGLPASVQAVGKPITFSDDTPEQTLQTAQREDRAAAQSLLQQRQPPLPPLGQQQQQLQLQQPSQVSIPQQQQVQAALALLQQHAQANQLQALLQQQQQPPPQHQLPANQLHALLQQQTPAQQAQLQMLLQQQAQQQQQQQVLPPLLQFNLKLQQPAPQQSQGQQQSTGSRPLVTGGTESGERQSQGLQALAADSIGFPASAGDCSLPSGSVPDNPRGAPSLAGASVVGPSGPPLQQQQQQQQQEQQAGGKQQQQPVQQKLGIATDEELEQLHEELLAQQDSKRRRMTQ